MGAIQVDLLSSAGFGYVAGDPEGVDLTRVAIFEPQMGDSAHGALVLLPNVPLGELDAIVGDLAVAQAAGFVVPDSAHVDELAKRHPAVALFTRPSGATLAESFQLIEAAASMPASGVAGALGEDDIVSLAESLAASLGGPVIVEDADLNVLSYSTYTGSFDEGRDATILGRQTSAAWFDYLTHTGILESIRTTDAVVEVINGPGNARRRLLTGLRDAGRFIGVLWLAEGDEPLPAEAEELLGRAARRTTRFLVRYLAQRKNPGTVLSAPVKDLVEGLPVPRSVIEQIGLDPRLPFVLLAVRSNGGDFDSRRVAAALNSYCLAHRWRGGACVIGRTVYLLVNPQSKISALDEVRLLESLGSGVYETSKRAARTEVLVVLSKPQDGSSRVRILRRRVDAALETFERMTQPGRGGVRLFTDLQIEMTLDAAADAIRDRVELDLEDLRNCYTMDTDAVRRETILRFVARFGNYRAAAEDLNIHATTVRYRLNTLQADSPLKVDDPRSLVFLALLLRQPH